jgi:hypothetical protein
MEKALYNRVVVPALERRKVGPAAAHGEDRLGA